MSPNLKIAKHYDSDKDVAFFKDLIPESSMMLSARNYAVLFPLDVHRPCGSLDDNKPVQVTKVVVKVPVELILDDDYWVI